MVSLHFEVGFVMRSKSDKVFYDVRERRYHGFEGKSFYIGSKCCVP